MRLRSYQERAIEQKYKLLYEKPGSHPVVYMPGGSGKSVVIAAFIENILSKWPDTRILMCVHSKELVKQNSAKLKTPHGVYCASLGRKEIAQITYASIASIYKNPPKVEVLLIDECHLLGEKNTGMYRQLIKNIDNPNLQIVGYSASPYRVGQGLLTEGKNPIFTDIIRPVEIKELVDSGYLIPLRAKSTEHKLSTDGIKTSQGDYVLSEMEERFNTSDNNSHVVSETIKRSLQLKHWLVFCSGIEHAKEVAFEFNRQGIPADHVSSKDTLADRDRKIADFESGKIRALCNMGLLTTGYDFPPLDNIVFLRGTKSPGLYLQMAVRGMRPFGDLEYCQALDFAGVVATHGPITCVQPPNKKSKAEGTAPVKTCQQCQEICHASVRICPACGAEFPAPEKPPLALRDDDIMGLEPVTMACTGWVWAKHVSRSSGQEMLKVSYWGGLLDLTVTEYLPIFNQGYAGGKAFGLLMDCARKAGIEVDITESLEDIAGRLNKAQSPAEVDYRRDGKFYRVLARRWPAVVAK